MAPPEVPSKPVTSYEYQQEETEEWTSTGETATTKEVTGLTNGASYTFRVRGGECGGHGRGVGADAGGDASRGRDADHDGDAARGADGGIRGGADGA